MNCKNVITHLMFYFSLTCMVSISSCKRVNDTKLEAREVNLEKHDASIILQEPTIMETGPIIESVTLDDQVLVFENGQFSLQNLEAQLSAYKEI